MNSCLKNNNNIDIDINIIDDQYCFEENNKNIDKEFFHFNQEEKNALIVSNYLFYKAKF